jgi:hypothetical protein
MIADDLKHFLGLKYNKVLEINLKQKEKVLYGKLRHIAAIRPKSKSSSSKKFRLDFDIINDIERFRHNRENTKLLKQQEILPEEIDSIGVMEL